jgi:hypothetical protein
VVVFPVITETTGQERVYDGYPDVALNMVSSRTFDERIQQSSPSLLANSLAHLAELVGASTPSAGPDRASR